MLKFFINGQLPMLLKKSNFCGGEFLCFLIFIWGTYLTIWIYYLNKFFLLCFIFQPKKFEYSLKSPGIKPMANRHSASSRSHPLAFGFTKSPDNDDTTSQPAATPPTTPCSPLTPPHSSGGSSNNVFTAG